MADVLADMVTAATITQNPACDVATDPSDRLLTRRGRRLKKRQRQRVEENSNAVVCPNLFESLDQQLSKEDGSATPYTWFVRSVGIIVPLPSPFVIGYFFTAVAQDEHSAQQALLTLWFSCFVTAVALLSLLQTEQVRRVIRPGEHLELLGMGQQKISERALADLFRWKNCWLRLAKGIGVGLLVTVVCTIVVMIAVWWPMRWFALGFMSYLLCEFLQFANKAPHGRAGVSYCICPYAD